MSNEIKIKSNGLRNELKEISKSIDKLTNAIIMAQTHKHYEKINYNSSSGPDDGLRWTTTATYNGISKHDERREQEEPARSKTSADPVA